MYQGWLGSSVLAGLIAVASLAVTLCALLPADIVTEAYLAATVMAAILFLHRRPRGGLMRVVLLVLCLLLTARYFSWRVIDTLAFYDPVSFVAALLLLGAEFYSLVLTLLGLIVNVFPITRQATPSTLGRDAPSVDILVPSYNETPELLAITLCAATQVAYPEGCVQVHLLDDGGTDQKCADANPAKAAAAQQRRRTLQALCARFGAVYHTRARNEHAKAGNINEVLPRLAGTLVLILDADHVPTTDILVRTVPLFIADPKLFLVQTPHFFTNPDTVEKNLDLFQKMPGENEMFHRAIQSGLDYWNCAIFCGSAAVLHRGRLLEVGGIATSTVTEDAETALALHACGYTSAYVAQPMVAGLAPETFVGMITQRVRWAQGMLQILLLKNPLRHPGLSWPQRLGYLSCVLYWMFPFARLVFLCGPIAYLMFGLRIYAADTTGVLVFVVPHMVASSISSSVLFGRFRWPLISHIYELLQSLLMLRPLWAVLRNPHAPNFNVTPKGEHLDHDFISPLATPFYVAFAIVLGTLPVGLWRLAMDVPHRSIILVTLLWEIFNLLLMLGALGALFERQQRRTGPRLRANMQARIIKDGACIPGRISDLSMGGVRFESDHAMPDLTGGGAIEIEVDAPHMASALRLHMILRTQRPLWAGMAFADREDQFAAVVRLVHGDSGRWFSFWDKEARRTDLAAAVGLLLRTGLVALGLHVLFLGRQALDLRRLVHLPGRATRRRYAAPTPMKEIAHDHHIHAT